MPSTSRSSIIAGLVWLGLFLGSCAQAPRLPRPQLIVARQPALTLDNQTPRSEPGRRSVREFDADWRERQVVAQGYLGVGFLSEVERQQAGGVRVDGSSDGLGIVPVAGGGFQRRLGGESLTYGLEGFLAASGRNNEELTRTTPGAGSVEVGVDLLLLDFYGGPFVSTPLNDLWRLYGSFGPLVQFAQWDESLAGVRSTNKGYGFGVYARIGVEYAAPSNDLIGLALRWSDSEVDLSGNQGDLELGGVQLVFTISRVM